MKGKKIIMSKRKKITYITGTRSEYGLMRSTLCAIHSHRSMKLSLIVVGMHLSKEYGYTINEVKKDGFSIDARIPALSHKTDRFSMVKNLGHYVIKMADVLKKSRPDMLLVEGDRGEVLAGAIAASHFGIPVAHVSGGDVTEGGMIDDSIRHAITKISHIHFPGTQTSARRILRMLEEPGRVHMVGTPDILTSSDFSSKDRIDLSRKLGINPAQDTIVVLQHPVTNEADKALSQIKETMQAVVSFKKQTVVIYPNSDAGSRSIIKVIKNYSRFPFVKIYKNLPYNDFMCLLSMASVFVGNSSAGIIRAPGFDLPFINVGSRQKGRERSKSIQDVGYNRVAIHKAIKKALGFRRMPVKDIKSPYRKLPTDRLIADILSSTKTDKSLLLKKTVEV